MIRAVDIHDFYNQNLYMYRWVLVNGFPRCIETAHNVILTPTFIIERQISMNSCVRSAVYEIKKYEIPWLQGKISSAPEETLRRIKARSEMVELGVEFHLQYEPTLIVNMAGEAKLVYEQFQRYLAGRQSLAATAYFIIDAMEETAKSYLGHSGGRTAASQLYNISSSVIGEVAKLSSERGGSEARKASGIMKPFEKDEKYWLESALKNIIQRMLEKHANNFENLPQINMGNISL